MVMSSPGLMPTIVLQLPPSASTMKLLWPEPPTSQSEPPLPSSTLRPPLAEIASLPGPPCKAALSASAVMAWLPGSDTVSSRCTPGMLPW